MSYSTGESIAEARINGALANVLLILCWESDLGDIVIVALYVLHEGFLG